MNFLPSEIKIINNNRAYYPLEDRLIYRSITWSKTCAINIDTKLFHGSLNRERKKEKEEKKEE